MVQKVITKIKKGDKKTDFEFWQTQPYEVRLATLEEIRREYHQWKYHAEPRLQRVYTIVKRK